MTREEQLVQQGWEKRTTYDEPRLSEIVEMYEEMDFEVHIEPLHPTDTTECTECMMAEPDRYKTIYTRRAKE